MIYLCRYEILLGDRGKDGKYKSIFKGTNMSCKIQDLRPGQDYHVCLQAHYLENIQGSTSEPAVFKTPACEPDTPFPPKLIQRTKNTLQVRWNAPLDNGANIIHYILECNTGQGGEFVEICKTKSKQFTASKLQPYTWYGFRLAAVNECGKSLYSDIMQFCTAANAPSPPQLTKATPSSLTLAWLRRREDNEFVLQMQSRELGHGFFVSYYSNFYFTSK